MRSNPHRSSAQSRTTSVLAALALLMTGATCGGDGGGGGSPPPGGGTGGSSPGTGGRSNPPAGSGGVGGSAGSSGAGGGGTAGSGGASGSGGSAPAPADGGAPPPGKPDGGATADGGGSATPPPTGPADYVNDDQFCQALGLTCGGDTLPDRAKIYHPVWCGQCPATSVCVATATVAGGAAGQCQSAAYGLDAGQRKVAAALTSLWENSSETIQYGFCKDIGDNRGFTAGRAGFCTGTGDAIVVVKCYAKAKPGNPLAALLPQLEKLEQKFIAADGDFEGSKSGDTSTIGSYCNAWQAAANDPAFRACQDAAVDSIYYGAALQHAAARHLTTALTKVSLWDGQIMHGESDAKFGMKKQLEMADAMVKLSPVPAREEESRWLGAFHAIRARIMNVEPEWKHNVYRVGMYEKLRLAGNLDFTGCVDTNGVSASDYFQGVANDVAPGANVCP